MKKYNVIFIIVDSVRNYRSGVDDRDRLDVMDEFSRDSVEFTNAITSAPSSILTASTMFTGLPSNMISRHFNDFDFDEKKISSLPNALMKEGYEVYSILNSREERRALQNLLHPLSKKYFTRGISHNNWWTNREVTDILENVLKKAKQTSPALYVLWYDCRDDPGVSGEVARALGLFREHGLYDNSIIIICSDHGYPDPSTGLTAETMKKFTHDMIVTDDNIRVPLFIRYPGCPAGKKVAGVVGVIDLFPTICGILGIPEQNTGFAYRGRSLIEAVKGRGAPRTVRTDTRLNLATGRITSLRSDSYKYLYYWDQKSEELYDLKKDPHETRDVLSGETGPDAGKALAGFRKLRDGMEQEINRFHVSVLGGNLEKNMHRIYPGEKAKRVKSVLLTTRGAPKTIVGCFLDSARKSFPNAEVDLLINKIDYDEYCKIGFGNVYAVDDMNAAGVSKSGAAGKKYDIVFYLTENARHAFVNQDIISAIRKLNAKSSFMLDYNFETYSRFLSKWIAPMRRYMNRNSMYYREEPSLIFRDVAFMVRAGINYNLRGDRLNPIDADKVKRMRDRRLKAAHQATK